MFEWLRNKRGRDVADDFVTEALNETARSVTYQRKIQTALATMGVTLADNTNKDEFCIEASTAIVKVIAEWAGVSTRTLKGPDQFKLGIIALIACDVVGHKIETKFDKPKLSYESDCGIIILNLFGAEDATETGQLIGQLMDGYNELAAKRSTIRELGNGLIGWFNDPHPERLKAIAMAYLASR
jgi:hypothetical protein